MRSLKKQSKCEAIGSLQYKSQTLVRPNSQVT